MVHLALRALTRDVTEIRPWGLELGGDIRPHLGQDAFGSSVVVGSIEDIGGVIGNDESDKLGQLMVIESLAYFLLEH